MAGTDFNPEGFRAYVDNRCAEQGLSRQGLADAAQIGRSSLFAWLAGTAAPTPSAWKAVADALGVPVRDLLVAADALPDSELAVRRLQLGWSRAQLARRARVSTATVASLECGKRVRMDAASRIVAVLKAPRHLVPVAAAPSGSTTRLGAQLEAYRRERYWTVTRLAGRLEVSRQMASAWLRGTEPVPESRSEQVAQLLGVPVEQVKEWIAADGGRSRPAAATGRLLRARRVERGWSQRELATQVGVSKSSVEHWEMGLRTPGADALERLCAALQLQAGDLSLDAAAAVAAAPAS